MPKLILLNQLSIIRDLRQLRKVHHNLIDVLFLAITAVISGYEDREAIENLAMISWAG